jgi:alkylation response protein AidB-like acyl-CoA dehydrogenase
MNFNLTNEQKDLYKMILEFSKKKLNDNVFIDDENSDFPIKKWKQCGELGIHGLPISSMYCGQEMSMLDTALAIESLAYGCMDEGLIFSICAHMLACSVPLNKFGNELQKKKYLPGLSTGDIICGNAISEADSGSDLKSLKTTIKKNDTHFILNGTKIFVSNGPMANLFIIYAKHKNGLDMLDISAFLVQKDFIGIINGQRFKKMGLRTCPLGEILLDNCEVPFENLLGRERMGMTIFNYSMLWERIIMSAYHLGSMKQQYEIALKYANTRKQFNQRIICFPDISNKLIDMKIKIKTSELLLYKTCWNFDNNILEKDDPSILKLSVSESKVKNSLDALQIFGAYGYLKENQVEKQLRDSIAATIYSGTSEIQRKIIAEGLVNFDE